MAHPLEVYLEELVHIRSSGAATDEMSYVVLLTQNSQFSPYVQQEIGFADAAGKRIIPLVQPGIDRRSLGMLVGKEHIPFDYQDPARALGSLLVHLSHVKRAKEQDQTMLMVLAALLVVALLMAGSD